MDSFTMLGHVFNIVFGAIGGLRLRYFPYIEQNHAWSADYQAAGRSSCSLNYTFTHIVVFRSTIQVCSPNTVLRGNINVGKSRPVFPISIQRNSGIHFRDMMPVVASLHWKSAPSGYKLEWKTLKYVLNPKGVFNIKVFIIFPVFRFLHEETIVGWLYVVKQKCTTGASIKFGVLVWIINKKVYLHNDNKKEFFSRFPAENIRILIKGYSS